MDAGRLLSFIVLSYNYENYIGITLQSILDQTIKDFEIVVVDDASEDRSCDIIRSFNDDRIRLLVNDRNLGGAASYNRAVRAATGKYLVNLDADDWIVPDKAERQLAAMATQQVEILGTYAHFVDKDGRPHPKAEEYERLINQPLDLNNVNAWIGRNNLVRSTTMVDRAAHLRVGLDDPTMVRAPDYELWTRALRAGCRFGVLPEPLTHYRLHPGGVTHGDPVGTFCELCYVMLRNLVPLAEAQENATDLACIANWIVDQGQNTALHSRQWHRLLGTMIHAPNFVDFADFAKRLSAESEETDWDACGRRLLAVLGSNPKFSQMGKLLSDLAAVSDARDFWHQQSDALTQARDFWHHQSDEWETKFRAVERDMVTKNKQNFGLLRAITTRFHNRNP